MISGVVVAGTAPGGNGIGTLYIGLQSSVDCFDGDSNFTQVIAGADLSQLGNEVPFSLNVPISEADAGDWVLQAFLDDDNDAVFEIPDEGDMTQSPTGFEEDGGCSELPPLIGDVGGLVITFDHIVG